MRAHLCFEKLSRSVDDIDGYRQRQGVEQGANINGLLVIKLLQGSNCRVVSYGKKWKPYKQ